MGAGNPGRFAGAEGIRTDSHRRAVRSRVGSPVGGSCRWRGPDCGVDGVNSVVDPEPQRTAWLVLVPWRLVWLRDSVTATPTDLAASACDRLLVGSRKA